jgi:hypothetical protein
MTALKGHTREPKRRGGAWTEEREARNERRATREGIAFRRLGSERDDRASGINREANSCTS